MGVAGKISQYRFGSGEGPFAVDVPSDLAQRRNRLTPLMPQKSEPKDEPPT
jgi:hypothetical protein